MEFDRDKNLRKIIEYRNKVTHHDTISTDFSGRTATQVTYEIKDKNKNVEASLTKLRKMQTNLEGILKV